MTSLLKNATLLVALAAVMTQANLAEAGGKGKGKNGGGHKHNWHWGGHWNGHHKHHKHWYKPYCKPYDPCYTVPQPVILPQPVIVPQPVAVPQPQIAIETPQQNLQRIPTGATINLPGTFGGNQGNVMMRFGGLRMAAQVKDWTATSVRVQLPELQITQAAPGKIEILSARGSLIQTFNVLMTPAQLASR